jgi:putative addiction module component (TIGR02574 family)
MMFGSAILRGKSMTQPLSQFDFGQLNPYDKLELISQLWDSLPDSPESLSIPEWHRQELEQRLSAADANPEAAISWEEAKDQLRKSS